MLRRASLRLLLVVGAASTLAGLAWGILDDSRGLTWILGAVIPLYGIAAFAYLKRPDHPSTQRLLVVGSLTALGVLTDVPSSWFAGQGSLPVWIPLLVTQLSTLGSLVAYTRLLGLYPDGTVERPSERIALRAVWPVLGLPLLLLLAHPRLVAPAYKEVRQPPNPLAVEWLEPLGPALALLQRYSTMVVLVGLALLIIRYRRSGPERRERIRVLAVPVWISLLILLMEFLLLALDPLDASTARDILNSLWLVIPPMWGVAIFIGLQRHRVIDVDLVLRRSLVYGVLWIFIAAVYVAVASALGIAAVERLPVGLALVLTIAVTLAFQPARARLERLADRWVFGRRLSRYEALSRLGATLERTFDLDDLLPRLAAAVRHGLAAEWVRVVVTGASEGAGTLEGRAGRPDEPPGGPDLVVPIVLAGDPLGRIECGPRRDRPFEPADEELLSNLARQAALGIRNLRLANDLGRTVDVLRHRTEELTESRIRLVKAGEAERRRIERNIHDGIQQDLVALIGQIGRAQTRIGGDPEAAGALMDVQRELGRLLTDLRELAHGIHPTVLEDRGLLEAVEAQAARSPLHVTVRADPVLRAERYPQEIEGAAYFTVSEGLANALKHAGASRAEVGLFRRDGRLRIEVADGGRGFVPGRARGTGLANLTERLEALGGTMAVSSRPGAGTRLVAEIDVEPIASRPRS